MSERLNSILKAVQSGELSVEDASAALSLTNVGQDACLDLARDARTGTPEIVYGASKTATQIIDITRAMLAHQHPVMVSKLSPTKASKVVDAIGGCLYDEVSGVLLAGQPPTHRHTDEVLVVSAGSSDVPVAREASLTLGYLGYAASEINDVGVAAIERILQHEAALAKARVVITIAGMEGALPSVVAGLTKGVVVAVPTSVGYGVSMGGIVAMASMLASCSPGIAVVNIDNGVGAAVVAKRILGGHHAE